MPSICQVADAAMDDADLALELDAGRQHRPRERLGGADRIAVHGAVVQRGHLKRRHLVGGQHPPVGQGERHPLLPAMRHRGGEQRQQQAQQWLNSLELQHQGLDTFVADVQQLAGSVELSAVAEVIASPQDWLRKLSSGLLALMAKAPAFCAACTACGISASGRSSNQYATLSVCSCCKVVANCSASAATASRRRRLKPASCN